MTSVLIVHQRTLSTADYFFLVHTLLQLIDAKVEKVVEQRVNQAVQELTTVSTCFAVLSSFFVLWPFLSWVWCVVKFIPSLLR